MPFDSTGFVGPRVLSPQEAHELKMLREARDGIAQSGRWCQYRYHGEWLTALGGAHCAIGWLEYVSRGNGHVLATAHLAPLVPRSYATTRDPAGHVIRYNDKKGRSQKMMVKLFDRAIAKLIDG